jgi:2,4-dienoyl-CoA reductase-like NADH-dependent reductase (Old Yellow Enzyme family)
MKLRLLTSQTKRCKLGFASPLSNDRTDRYGGSLSNRLRLTLEITEAVRAAWPSEKPLIFRVSATDFAEGEERRSDVQAGDEDGWRYWCV